MDFALSSDQQMIRESAQEFLAETSSSEAVREAMATEQGFLPQFWQQLAQELGWCGIHIPETHGGVGLSGVELVLLLEQMGYHLACAPFSPAWCWRGMRCCTVPARWRRKPICPLSPPASSS